MKQIFDWLREQIVNRKAKNDFLEDRVWNHAMRVCIEIVDEAEAKWEAENTYRCNGNYNDNYKNALKVCPHCGKPIKISEVE